MECLIECKFVDTLVGRNEVIFYGSAHNIFIVELLVKIRSFKWILDFGELRNDLKVLWRVNLVGVFTLS